MPGRWQLAQVNVGLVRVPVDAPRLAGFVEMLEPINALADSAPGFVWRLQTEDGDATAIRAFEDDRMLMNMSVWESVEELADFVFASRHVDVMRKRREWFHPLTQAYTTMWWIPAGTIPTVDEARRRLELLERLGPTAEAFTFRMPFPAPDSDEAAAPRDDWLCPA